MSKHLYYSYSETHDALVKLNVIKNDMTADKVKETVFATIKAKAKADTIDKETVPNLLTNRSCGYDEKRHDIAYDAIVTVFDGAIDVDGYNANTATLACDDYQILIDLRTFANKTQRAVMSECLNDLVLIGKKADYSKADKANALISIRRYLNCIGLTSLVDSFNATDAVRVLKRAVTIDKCGNIAPSPMETGRKIQFIACRIVQGRAERDIAQEIENEKNEKKENKKSA